MPVYPYNVTWKTRTATGKWSCIFTRDNCLLPLYGIYFSIRSTHACGYVSSRDVKEFVYKFTAVIPNCLRYLLLQRLTRTGQEHESIINLSWSPRVPLMRIENGNIPDPPISSFTLDYGRSIPTAIGIIPNYSLTLKQLGTLQFASNNQ